MDEGEEDEVEAECMRKERGTRRGIRKRGLGWE